MKKYCFAVLMIFFASGAALPSAGSNSEQDLAFDTFYEYLSEGDFPFAAMLLDLNPQFKNVRNYLGQTLLHSAILHDFPQESVSFLIHNGWDVNAQDLDGKTSFMYALEQKYNSHIIQLLFESQ